MNDPCLSRQTSAATLERQLSAGRTTKILRFVLNVLSSTPIIGGFFSATASAWSEFEQGKTNELLHLLQEHTDDAVTELRGELSQASNPAHVVAGSITFNPNTAELISTSSISSLTDNGTLDFTISFARPLEDYVFMYYGSGPIALKGVTEAPGGMRILFAEPAPSRITIAFFEQHLSLRSRGARAST